MAGVTPRQIYTALISAGATQVQAIGIMANGIAESGLNPEAIGDGGTSFGLWQEHGTQYAGLVTGKPVADMNAQVRVLAMNKGFAAASGATAGAAAGNFSANYERCVGCQQGGAQYNARVANAGVVAGWVSSGKWPASAPANASGSASSSSGGSAGSSGSADPSCAFALPQVNLKVTTVGGGCLIHKSTIRHVVGGLLISGGVGVGLVGAVLLAAFAFRASGAQRAGNQIAGAISPVRGAVQRSESRRQRETAATQRRTATAQRQAATRQRQQQRTAATAQRQQNAQARRSAGSPAQQRRAVSGQAPRRRPATPPAQQRAPRAEHHE